MRCLWIDKGDGAGYVCRRHPTWLAEQVVVEPGTATQAMLRLQAGAVDLVVAHWAALVPDGAGWCRDLHTQMQVPLLVITQAHDTVARIVALESGACDVVQEGVGSAELLARMRAAVRRAQRAF